MADQRWGTKRRCTDCGAAFYDMRRTPIICPKCGVKHTPVVLLASDGRGPRKDRRAPFTRVAAEPVAASAAAEPETEAEEAEDVEIDDVVDADETLEPAIDVDENDRDA
ncbi:MAG TPA: TIGR02300 family protein [Alphaproteobacteria bacterium]